MIVKKYEFPSEKKADEYIKKLPHAKDDEGNKYPTHKNSIVKIGFICIKDGEIDENGEQIKAPKYAKKYSVDVLWHNSILPGDDDSENYIDLDYILWSDYEINIEDQGVHRFMGVDYIP